MKIYTKTGDKGSTVGLDAIPISKNTVVIHAVGSIDELNSALGVIIAHMDSNEIARIIMRVQRELFSIGSYISSDNAVYVKKIDVTILERQIDQWTAQLPPLRNFILPGGSIVGAQIHLARSISRRAERDLIALHEKKSLEPQILEYINRLSDWLFTLARYINMQAGSRETIWQQEK